MAGVMGGGGRTRGGVRARAGETQPPPAPGGAGGARGGRSTTPAWTPHIPPLSRVIAAVRAEERAAAAGLAEALREIQWTSADEDSIDLYCVLCDGTPTTGHREFCSVGMALAAWDAQ